MDNRRFLVLKSTPHGLMAVYPPMDELLTFDEAKHCISRHILNTLAAGGEPDKLKLIECAAEPRSITAADLESFEIEEAE